MKIKIQNKLTLLDAIRQRKNVLFSNFKTTSNVEKVESWKSYVPQKCNLKSEKVTTFHFVIYVFIPPNFVFPKSWENYHCYTTKNADTILML